MNIIAIISAILLCGIAFFAPVMCWAHLKAIRRSQEKQEQLTEHLLLALNRIDKHLLEATRQ